MEKTEEEVLYRDASNDVAPPKAKKEKNWLGLNMTFLMVLLNGLILTGTAFAILTVFINEMKTEDREVVTNHFQEMIGDRFKDGLLAIEAIAAMTNLDSYNLSLNKGYDQKLSDSLDLFDAVSLYRVSKDGQEEPFEEIIHISPEFAQGDKISSSNLLKKALKTELPIDQTRFFSTAATHEADAANALNENEALIAPINPSSVTIQNQNVTEPIVVARKLKSDALYDYTLIIQTDIGRLLDTDLESWREVSGFSVIDRNGKALLTRVAGDKMSNIDGVEDYRAVDFETSQEFPQELFGREVFLRVNVKDDTRGIFLGVIPYLMLMFGGVLTVIGALYVFNNQRQARRLTSMNQLLAKKNAQLNKQFGEKENLFQALRASEIEYRQVINSVNDVILETDEHGDVVFLNDSWEAITGLESKKTIGKSLFNLVHPKDRTKIEQMFENAKKNPKKTERSFMRIKTLPGKFHEVETTLSLMERSSEDEDIRLVGTIVDIEERRKAEKALAEAERKYRNIIENALAGIYQMTPEGQFISANPALANMLGYETPYELMQSITDFAAQCHVDASRRYQLAELLEKDGAFNNYEVPLKHKNGHTIWVNVSARLVKDEEGATHYYEGIMEDITQRREAEIALKEAKLESDIANRAKSEFLANMSHELRTPLNAIIGFSEIIKNEVFGPVGHKEYNEYAADIHNSGRRLLKVINEILDVSKIEAGERQLNENLVNIEKVVQTCCSLIVPKLESSSIKLENMLGEDTPKIIGEELAIKQMVMNLLSNAVKFTPAGGQITISCDVRKNGSCRLNIKDTGVGMAADQVEKAISPFGQLDTKLSRANSGTGLGLTLVNSLIKLHGGSLDIKSKENKGTTASLVFPSKRVALNKTSGDENSSESDKKKTNVVKFNDTK